MLHHRRRCDAVRVRGPNHPLVTAARLTGAICRANLSEQYFTDRQDRYYWFKQTGALANFYANLLGVVEALSFGIHPVPRGIRHDATGLFLPAGVPDPSVDPTAYKTLFKSSMDAFWSSSLRNQSSDDAGAVISSSDTLVFPTCQVGPCDVTNDSQIIDLAVATVPESSPLHLTTPYCNFTPSFSNVLFNDCKSHDIRVIVAHPTANGFFKGKGAHTLIPWAYSSFLERFHALVASAGQHARLQLLEYERPEWTFHAKGLWFEFPPVNDAPASAVSIVGSSNFGVRSSTRDLEAQAVVISQNAALVDRMRQERENIFKTSSGVSLDTFADRKKHTPWWLPLVMFFARRFM